MLKNLLQKIEEKYVFNISHYFWHIFVALSTLALLGGVLLLLWGIIPPFRDGVEKQDYPPVVNVEPNEVIAMLNATDEKSKQTTTTRTVTQTQQKTSPVSYSDPDEGNYNRSLDSLKKLVPPEKYSWASSGYWYYPYGEQYYRYYRDRGYNVENYRQWIVTSTGVEERLRNTFSEVNATSYKERKNLIDRYIIILSGYSEDKRMQLLKSLIGYKAQSSAELAGNLDALAQSVANFDTSNTAPISRLITFGSRNPKEGRTLILYINKIMPKFVSASREEVLESIIGSFYSYFNNKVDRQIEITDLFINNLDKYKSDQYSKALETYYSLMVIKNEDRERQIQNIENEYNYALTEAELKYEESKVEKAGLRLNGLYIAGGAITFISLLALILVMLSIQRHVRKINDVLTTDNQK